MSAIMTHPTNALQAKTFTAPGSLSYPGGASDVNTPPSSDSENQKALANGHHQGQDVGNTPATPAATPGAGPGVSGIVPTLQ